MGFSDKPGENPNNLIFFFSLLVTFRRKRITAAKWLCFKSNGFVTMLSTAGIARYLICPVKYEPNHSASLESINSPSLMFSKNLLRLLKLLSMILNVVCSL